MSRLQILSNGDCLALRFKKRENPHLAKSTVVNNSVQLLESLFYAFYALSVAEQHSRPRVVFQVNILHMHMLKCSGSYIQEYMATIINTNIVFRKN